MRKKGAAMGENESLFESTGEAGASSPEKTSKVPSAAIATASAWE
jgi:hypothetical protein